jgi:hypothetical protein
MKAGGDGDRGKITHNNASGSGQSPDPFSFTKLFKVV